MFTVPLHPTVYCMVSISTSANDYACLSLACLMWHIGSKGNRKSLDSFVFLKLPVHWKQIAVSNRQRGSWIHVQDHFSPEQKYDPVLSGAGPLVRFLWWAHSSFHHIAPCCSESYDAVVFHVILPVFFSVLNSWMVWMRLYPQCNC